MTSSPALLNRELGLIEFNRRVLAQAEDAHVPLLERLKFLCIVSSNLDEFFEVRVAWLKACQRLTPSMVMPDGLNASQSLEQVSHHAHALVERQYALMREVIFPALSQEGIHFVRRAEWSPEVKAWIHAYFHNDVMPVLTPIGLDPSHPFPKLLNKSLNFAIELEGRDAFGRSSGIAIVQAPRILPRVIQLPVNLAGGPNRFVFLSSILHAHLNELFLGMVVKGVYQFRLTRDSELTVEEDELKNLRTALQGELRHRQYGEAVRLEIADNCPEHMEAFLLSQFSLSKADIYRVEGPVNLVRLMQVPDLVDRPDLKYPPFTPGFPAPLTKKHDLLAAIRKQDILLHHPYQSFQPVLDFLNIAATDPNVVAIKMTVYRTGTESALMESLIAAARTGKQVTVVVELMARFDEEANIGWASRLEDAGAHVVYGVYGYKIHAKMLMVVRREEGHHLRRYIHLGTGNYHPRTARLYTDFGLLTCNPDIASDVNDIFTQITGLGKMGELRHLLQSPFSLHPGMMAAIAREADHARAGRPATIIAKMNSLLEPKIIEALYAASQAGVKIQLIVRGVCALRPGVAGLSDHIEVRSVIGRFLEHTRIFYFLNDRQEDVFISSADWMGRNFFRRIETCTPVLDPKLKRRVIKEGLRLYLADNVNAWMMQPDGSYRHRNTRAKPHAAQDDLLLELAGTRT